MTRATHDDVIFNFALLPDEAFSTELVRASRALGDRVALDYVLGENSLPHVTVLQFPGRESEADAIWSRLGGLEIPPLPLHFNGLAFERWRSWDGIWLRLKHCGPLRDLQARARKLLHDREFVNGLDDAYEPHATLGAWAIAPEMPAFPIPAGILDRRDVTVCAALGISGPQFQFARALHRRS